MNRTAPADAVRVVTAARRHGVRRARTVSLLLLAVVVVVFGASLSVGDFTVPIPELLRILSGSGTGRGVYVVTELRLPRAVCGLLVGVAFGLAGALFQRLLRNPLASPDVVGVTSGASAAGVVCLVVFGASGAIVSAGALAGGVATAAAIYLLAWRRGMNGYRLVLVGIGIAAVLSSVISFLMTWADVQLAQQALVWLTGNLNGRGWEHVGPLALGMAVLVPLALLLSRTLAALQLGDDSARGIGVAVERGRLGLILIGVALASLATAAAGPVAFVAFVSNPIATRLVGGSRPSLVPAALTGALVTLAGDFAAAHLLGTTQLPVGVVTGAVGAPYLLLLLARANRAGRI
ncbi:FecCD family ABC transporter permease [Amycolatopsis sp. NPDC058986]|uniref:FecCD family ABC transporter permease n=1 Tax=unclassified Amycolatopsis TaxID=2618356 RepID=UPI0036704A94